MSAQNSRETLLKFFDERRVLGISGASGSGKSFFARRLCSDFGGVLQREGVRQWLEDKPQLTYSSIPPDQFAQLQLHLLECFEKSTATVWDRTPLDCLVYIYRASNHVDLDSFRKRARAILARIEVLVFFPAHSRYLLEDGVRVVDFKHQVGIASKMYAEAVSSNLEDKVYVYDHWIGQDENIELIARFISDRLH